MMIATHFINSLVPPHTVKTVTSSVKIGDNVATVTETIELGKQEAGCLKKNEQVTVTGVKVTKEGYMTFSNLLRKMEQNHIGTDATVAQHISGLSTNGYANVVNDTHLQPTKLGYALIDAI